MGLTNQFIADMKSAEPKVGMEATFLSFSDRKPGTVSEIIGKKTIRVEHCDYEIIKGDKPLPYGTQPNIEFKPRTIEEITAEPKGQIYTLRKNGRWVLQGCSMNQTGCTVMLGKRDYYYDFSF